MGKLIAEIVAGYICRCNSCEQAGELKLIGRDLDANYISARFDEIYGNHILSKIYDELRAQNLIPQPDWTSLQTQDYQAKIATRYGELKQYVLTQGIKQVLLTFEDNNNIVVLRCPDCTDELVRIRQTQ
ncbi:MAG: hypothetical protein HYU02_02070 [Thaumarchaeota archaeon]|nr:hypothetical protein [Nitrososphaerota archaeon]